MKIVVEGFDNSGKSTLINKLAKTFKLDIHWAGGPPKNHVIALSDSTTQLSMEDIIHDRITPISRQCYESPEAIKPEMIFLPGILKNFIRCKSKFIYCTGKGIEHMLSECDSDDHLTYITENEVVIKLRYEHLFESIPHIKYDFNRDSVVDVINYIRG